MKKIRFIIAMVLTFQLIFPAAYAGIPEVNPVRKLMRGVVNMALCWAELVRQPILTNKEEGDLPGITWGVSKGVGFTFGRAILGTYETVTFLIPPYRTLVEPEFIFSDKAE